MPRRSQDKIQSRGIGLRLSEWEEIDKIADGLGMTPHAVVAYAIRYFLKHWHEEKIKPQTQVKKTTSLPDL